MATNGHKDGLKLPQQQIHKYNREILTATWLPPQYAKLKVLKFNSD